ncbi:MAG TPA: hypothetical protein ENJ82_08825, partial [Bacteroidetes bacterium]|nr:hypothetical protein [Bacteroidota bacterium]
NKFRLDVTLAAELVMPGKDSLAHFFKEHDLGFGKDSRGETLCYRVWHPVWKTREILDIKFDFDFELLYGPEWAFLNDLEPFLKMYAVGSAIKVYTPVRLEEGIPVWEADEEVAGG